MKKTIVPDEVVKSLIKLEKKTALSDKEKTVLDTFLFGLETGIVNPACTSKILVNPIPREPNVSLPRERTLEERIKHINTVSSRVRNMMQPEPEGEQLDFDSVDDSFDLLPKSIFEVADHGIFHEEVLPPEPQVPNPDLNEPVLEPGEPPDPNGGEPE